MLKVRRGYGMGSKEYGAGNREQGVGVFSLLRSIRKSVGGESKK